MVPDEIDDFQEMAARIEAVSPYREKRSGQKKLMSVREMGDLLGLKKTDRYWLVHKGFFETKVIHGKMYVDIDSFEKWYANQVKHRKVNGEEPGRELRAWTYSPQEICEILGVTSDIVYDLLIKENIETVTVDHWKRVPKKAFEKWYAGQSKYRNERDRKKDAPLEEATISMPEMARLLGVTRNEVYRILSGKRYGHFFECVMIADRKRITKESFQTFLEGQDQYQLCDGTGGDSCSMEDRAALADHKRRIAAQTNERTVAGNRDYLSRTQAAVIADVSDTTISEWARSGYFPELRLGDLIRIPRSEFEAWLQNRKEMEG